MPLSRRFKLSGSRRWWVVPSLVAIVAGAQFCATADEQVASRRRKTYCPPTYPCPPQQVMPYAPPTLPTPHHPTPVKPTDPKAPNSTTPPSTTPPSTNPQSTTPNNTNNNQTNTPTQTDPNDLRNTPQQPQAPQTQTQIASATDAQSAAPNIIGDFFGATFASGNVFLPIPTTNISAFPAVGSSVPFLIGDNGDRYGLPDPYDPHSTIPIDITASDQLITGLVLLDPATNTPIAGSPTYDISNVNGIQQSAQQQSFFGPQTPNVIVGTVKFTEAVSILPRDRVLFNYSYFQQTPLTADGLGVNRMIPGFEKTFFNGATSIEVRAPFATTLDSNNSLNGDTRRDSVEFGDISIFAKALLAQSDTVAFTAGIGLVTPTSDDLAISIPRSAQFGGGTSTLIQVDHKSFRIAPFVGALWTPNDNWFSQGVLQIDTPITGDSVLYNPTAGQANDSGALGEVGRINNPTFLYLSGSTGYWVYRDAYAEYFGISGFAPIAELHINQSLNSEDSVTGRVNGRDLTFGGTRENITNVNATIGAVTQFGQDLSMYVGYATPLGNGVDKSFDGELRVLFNWRFGAGGYRNVPVFQ